jgi:hypothetical protein
MPLPKRPSGGAAPQNAAPPQFGEQENQADEEFSLPELDDFVLPDLMFESETEQKESSSISETFSSQATIPDSSRSRFTGPSSTNQATPEPAQAAASDVLDTSEDEDEETALNRELGLLDDDFTTSETLSSDASDTINSDDSDSVDSSLIELEENLLEAEDDGDDEFEDLLRGLEETTREPDVEKESSAEDDVDAEWEAALSELESFNESTLPEVAEAESITDSDEDEDEDDDDEDEEEDGDWNLEAFTPPANPFESLPEDFQNAFDTDDDEDEDEEDDTPEDDFIPPSDPFANPFANEDSKTDEDEEPAADSEETAESPASSSLKDKAAALLSPAKAKRGLADYFAKINAELHGEEPPKPGSRSERNPEAQEQDEDSEGQTRGRGGSARSPLKIFGFLAPIRSFYTAIVNIIFGIITTILGILSKLPLIGFVFKIALEATKVLRAIAQYIPLVFFIGALVAVSYFSVPRDSLIGLPDSGGATFTDFKYEPSSNSVSGVITNTGDVIADVQPEFTVKTIQPGLNPVSWVIPEATSKCVTTSVRVDIDSTTKVTAKCSEVITGFIPRVTGELK